MDAHRGDFLILLFATSVGLGSRVFENGVEEPAEGVEILTAVGRAHWQLVTPDNLALSCTVGRRALHGLQPPLACLIYVLDEVVVLDDPASVPAEIAASASATVRWSQRLFARVPGGDVARPLEDWVDVWTLRDAPPWIIGRFTKALLRGCLDSGERLFHLVRVTGRTSRLPMLQCAPPLQAFASPSSVAFNWTPWALSLLTWCEVGGQSAETNGGPHKSNVAFALGFRDKRADHRVGSVATHSCDFSGALPNSTCRWPSLEQLQILSRRGDLAGNLWIVRD